jgi:hypothetical protein
MLSSLFGKKPTSHAVRLAPSGVEFTAAPKETLLQAALNSGARYVGLLNTDVFRVGRTLVVNGPDTPGRVELFYGLMSEILVDRSLAARKPPYDQINEGLLFRLGTGQRQLLHLKGLRIQPDG